MGVRPTLSTTPVSFEISIADTWGFCKGVAQYLMLPSGPTSSSTTFSTGLQRMRDSRVQELAVERWKDEEKAEPAERNTLSHAIAITIMALLVFAAVEASAGTHPGLRVAMCQTEIVDGDIAENMRRAEKAIREAVLREGREKQIPRQARDDHGVDLVCLPEAADWGWLYEHSRRDAFPIPGAYADLLAKLAQELEVWVCAGCLERDGDKTYNSAVLIDRTGKIVLKHRKINTLKFLTKNLYDTGTKDDIKVVDTEIGRVGITICADNFNLGIPKKVADQGAWLLITPHGFAAEPDKLEKNAAEFQEHIKTISKHTKMWVIGTNTCLGPIAAGAWKGRPHSGCSTLARPDGTAAIVARFNTPDLVLFDIPAEK